MVTLWNFIHRLKKKRLIWFAVPFSNPYCCYSDMQVDVHNDLFLSASLIGEAMQSMVNTVSRDIGKCLQYCKPRSLAPVHKEHALNTNSSNFTSNKIIWVKQPPDGFKLSLKLLRYRRYFFVPVFVLDLCVCDNTPPLGTSLFWIPSVCVAALWFLSVRYTECPVRVSPSWVTCVCFVV